MYSMITMKRKVFAIAAIFVSSLSTYGQEWTRLGSTLTSYAQSGNFIIAKDGKMYAAYNNLMNANMLNVQSFKDDWDWYGSRDFSRGPAHVFSLAADNSGVVYVAYRDQKRGEKCIVQKFDGGGFSDLGGGEVSTGFVNSTALAFDNSNTPYVAFADQSNQKLQVYKYANNSWSPLPLVLDATGDLVNLAFDNNNNLYACFKDTKNANRATVKKFNGTGWTLVGQSPVSEKEVAFLNFVIDSKGTLYVAYLSTWDGSVQVKKFAGTSWTNVGSAVFVNTNTDNVSLALDANDTPYVGYHNHGGSNDNMEVKKFAGNQWVALPLAGKGGGGVGRIAIKGTEIYVAFKEDGNGLVVKKLN